ncbi:MAG: cell division transport system permease protein [Flavobacteriales bacterium]|jgi:cell division transport system permease protein
MSRGASRRPGLKSEATEKSAKATRLSAKGVSAKGATQSRTGVFARFRSYAKHHKTSMLASYERLLASPLQTLMTSLVVAVALTLPVLLLLVLSNLQALGGGWESTPKMQVFFNIDARDTAIKHVLTELDTDKRVRKHRFISQTQALADFQTFSGFSDVLDALSENPLPASVEIEPDSLDISEQQSLAQYYQENPIVERVMFDMAWVQRFVAIMALAEKLVWVLAALLSLGAILAIGNTVRLVIESRKEEIVVIKLVGGTDGFVRRPLLYTGGLYGVMGALLSCFMVMTVVSALEGPLQTLLALYQSDFSLSRLNMTQVLALLGLGAFLGWSGALLAVGRHLADIEPK